MIVTIQPSKARGVISAPPSKSFAHRALICAGLSKGISKLSGISDSQDMQATMDCLKSLGATFKEDGNTLIVKGIGGDLQKTKSQDLFCRESGSTLRFFIPICLTQKTTYSLFGSQRLLERPNLVYSDLCEKMGLSYELKDDHIEVCGPLSSGTISLRGDVSSQFISGLLFALPLLSDDSIISITTNVESRPYIDITLDTLSHFGVHAEWKNSREILVFGNQKYIPCDFSVEGDYSNAAFLSALGKDVQVQNLNPNTKQGDSAYLSFFSKLELGYTELDVSDTPDLAPILMAYAANHYGAKLTGTKRLKIKESDRGEAMKIELEKFGIPVSLEENSITIGCGIHKPNEKLNSHNDHRIAMSCAYLMTFVGGTLEGAEAVNKSYPNFFSDIRNLGIEVNDS